MHRKTATVVLASATAAVLAIVAPLCAAPAANPPAQPPDAQTDVPVKEVVLFSSGVGYFEHFGQVTGNSATVLHFKTEQINDILKSLVLEDMDRGKVAAVTYPSQGPLEHTLKSFQLDLTSNPSLSQLLNQLRGAQVSVTLAVGARHVEGTVLGVEKQQRPSGDKEHPALLDVWVLNLVGESGIQPVDLAQISDLKIEDPELRKELAAALKAVAQARDKDKKPVEIHFEGQGERRVRIGYVVETPVWKTSYRLILGGPGDGAKRHGDKETGGQGDKATGGGGDKETGGQADKARGGGGDKETGGQEGNAGKSPATPPLGARNWDYSRINPPSNHADVVEPHTTAALQGWAIVENQTDSDWKNVQLSLVSGRPISFIEDLYQPLYIPRPVVQPELYASLRPQAYGAGMDEARKALNMQLDEAQEDKAKGGAMGNKRDRAFGMNHRALQSAAARAPGMPANEMFKSMDAAASISSVASASKVGELFQYTVGNVSIRRQQSAMLPIVTDPVQVEKLSIYNQSVMPKNPLLGARLKNTTGKYLLQGPITVLSGGTYAGDASIEDLPPGQQRLISYGIDQEVLVHASDNTQNSQLLTGKIVKGVLELTYKQVFSQEYTAEDKADAPRELLIEAPRHPGWTLVEPKKAMETTDTLYRFQGRIQPHQPSKVVVREEHTDLQQISILPMDIGALETYVRTGEIPQAVRDALAKAAELKGALTDTQRQIQEKQQKLNEIAQEQNRIRENMKAVSQSSAYSNRLLAELDQQETQIQDLHKQVQQLQKQQDGQRSELEDYLSKLSVG